MMGLDHAELRLDILEVNKGIIIVAGFSNLQQKGALKLLVFFWGFWALTVPAGAFSFSEWNFLLKKYVSPKTISGVRINAVDYKQLKSDPVFKNLVSNLNDFSPSDLSSKKDQLAFWINAYNIMAVKTVLDHYPIKSIKDVGNLFHSVWGKKVGIVGGKPRTLNEIEHEILRKMDEPRIHFAIVCASVSCPDLRKEPFAADNLSTQLEEQTKLFLGNQYKGLRIENKKIYISAIFKWFKEDFESRGGVLKFIEAYVNKKNKTTITPDQKKIVYMDYNWKLNIL